MTMAFSRALLLIQYLYCTSDLLRHNFLAHISVFISIRGISEKTQETPAFLCADRINLLLCWMLRGGFHRAWR